MLTHQQFIPEIIAIDGLHGISLSNYIHFLSDSIIHFYREAMPWYWGVFRWLSLTYPRPVHRIINVIILISLIGIGKFFLDKNPQRLGAFPSRLIVLFLMFVSGFYFIGLTTFNYLFYVSHGYLLGIQGRYFFPTILAHMALVTIGIMSVIPRHMKKVILTLLSLCVVGLHTYAFVFVAGSYYDFSNIQTFFIQVSQYKPFFFKSPNLEYLSILFSVSLITLIWYYLSVLFKKHEQS